MPTGSILRQRTAWTVRRDLEAIESAGFPLLTERIDGLTRWKLLNGTGRAPTLRFSPTELLALLLSWKLITPLEGTAVHASLLSALSKASAALPPESLRVTSDVTVVAYHGRSR